MKKRHLILLLTVSALLGCSRHSFPTQTMPPAATATQVEGRYEAQLLETVAGPLPYRVAHLNPDSLPGKPALVLYLHSANGRGSDNISQLRQQKAVDSIYNYLVANRMRAIFLVPQCPSDKYWAGNQEYPAYINLVKELL